MRLGVIEDFRERMGCGSSSVAAQESRNSVDKPPDENNNARTKSIAKRSAKKSPQANNALVLEDLEDRGTIRLLLLGGQIFEL